MWHLDHELEIHFQRLNASRDRSGDGDEQAPMTQNALTAGLRR